MLSLCAGNSYGHLNECIYDQPKEICVFLFVYLLYIGFFNI